MAIAYNPRIVTDGLVLALDAGNRKSYPGSGATWTDLSGNRRNFTWNSAPSFTSDGVKSYFSTLGNICLGPASNSFDITNTSGYTIFVICLQNTLASNAAFKFYAGASGASGRGIAAHLAWGDGNIYFDQGGCCSGDTRTQVASGGTNTWNMWSFRRLTNSSTRHIIKNATTLTTNTATALDLNLSSTSVELGGSAEFGGVSSAWDARLNSFYVYNRGLTDAEIQQNFNATRGRFGI